MPYNLTSYYQNFYENSPSGFFKTRLEDGEFIRANKYLVKLLGFPTFKSLKENSKAVDFYLPGDREELINILINEGEVFNFKVVITLLDETKKTVLINAKLSNSRKFIEGTVLDITEAPSQDHTRVAILDRLQDIRHSIKKMMNNYSSAG